MQAGRQVPPSSPSFLLKLTPHVCRGGRQWDATPETGRRCRQWWLFHHLHCPSLHLGQFSGARGMQARGWQAGAGMLQTRHASCMSQRHKTGMKWMGLQAPSSRSIGGERKSRRAGRRWIQEVCVGVCVQVRSDLPTHAQAATALPTLPPPAPSFLLLLLVCLSELKGRASSSACLHTMSVLSQSAAQAGYIIFTRGGGGGGCRGKQMASPLSLPARPHLQATGSPPSGQARQMPAIEEKVAEIRWS